MAPIVERKNSQTPDHDCKLEIQRIRGIKVSYPNSKYNSKIALPSVHRKENIPVRAIHLNLSKESKQKKKILENSTTVIDKCTKFRIGKSLSLMDFNRDKRSPLRQPNTKMTPRKGNALKKYPQEGSGSQIVRNSLIISDDFNWFYDTQTAEQTELSKNAGLKILTTIMRNAWRRRRDEVQRLVEEVSKYKKNSIKSKNQIHVLNSLYRVEQKQNDDLNTRIRQALDEQKRIQDLYDQLNLSYLELKNNFINLERGIAKKNNEYNSLNILLCDSKAELLEAITRERELENMLLDEQRKLMTSENEKSELTQNYKKLFQNTEEKEAIFNQLIAAKDDEINQQKKIIGNLGKKLEYLKKKEAQLKEFVKSDIGQRKIIQNLTENLKLLEYQIDNTIPKRSRKILIRFSNASLKYLHQFFYHLLIAIPEPTKVLLPKKPNVEKILNYVWKYNS